MTARERDNCPHCGTGLNQELPDGRSGRREIGLSAQDYVQFWICPDCSATWNRWEPDDRRFGRAEELRAAFKQEVSA